MSFRPVSAIGALSSLAALALFLVPETVGYASSGAVVSADKLTEIASGPVQIEVPAGWLKTPAAENGALFALRCEAKGCIPGVMATMSCISAAESHAGRARELAALASGRTDASVLEVGGHEFHERSSVLNDGRYVLAAATKVGDQVCGLGLTGPRSEGARLDLTIRSMLSRLRFS